MGENQTYKIQNGVLVSLAHGGNVGKVGAKQRRLVNDGNGVKDGKQIQKWHGKRRYCS